VLIHTDEQHFHVILVIIDVV